VNAPRTGFAGLAWLYQQNSTFSTSLQRKKIFILMLTM
jgi:hypothetical protein